MSGTIRKGIARRLIQGAGQGDLAAVELLISPDFVLEQMLRDPDTATTAAGTRYDRSSYLGFLGAVKSLTREGMNLSIDLLVEEGDNLVVFGTSNAISPSGWHYRNAYCWHLSFAGNQVERMREYFDTTLGARLLAE